MSYNFRQIFGKRDWEVERVETPNLRPQRRNPLIVMSQNNDAIQALGRKESCSGSRWNSRRFCDVKRSNDGFTDARGHYHHRLVVKMSKLHSIFRTFRQQLLTSLLVLTIPHEQQMSYHQYSASTFFETTSRSHLVFKNIVAYT